ncbi:hypothetical protein J1614_011191 [Plenodomus biglobosus]|nr:hypothetical protein J1614_011191 [Plenodomus biglobosus]
MTKSGSIQRVWHTPPSMCAYVTRRETTALCATLHSPIAPDGAPSTGTQLHSAPYCTLRLSLYRNQVQVPDLCMSTFLWRESGERKGHMMYCGVV